jgi:hypothetical protein
MKILFQSLVKSFYRENAGAILFFLTLLIFIVGDFHGAGVVAYHYSLITGLLGSPDFLLLVCFLWFVYARKCISFVSGILYKPEYAFLHIYNNFSKLKRFRLFLFVEFLLLLPVLLYAILIVVIGWQQHFYAAVTFVAGYLLVLCITAALRHVYILNNAERKTVRPLLRASFYPVILLKSVPKFLWLGIKLFTCIVLYGTAKNNTVTVYDPGTVFWLFNFGIIANGVLVYRIRTFEEKYLLFYRGAAVSLSKRLLEYSLVYFILLIPEFIILLKLTPVHLHYHDAINFALCSYGLLLFMNSITFLHPFSMKTYLKIVLLIAVVQFFFLIFAALTALYLIFFVLAIVIFMIGYYRFSGSTSL